MKRLPFLLLAMALAVSPSSHAQGAPATASRLADLQLGGGYTLGHTDYVPNNISGYAFYGDYDLLGHYGLEGGFHYVRDPNPDPIVPSNHFSEHTYEVGGRYLRHYDHGRLAPYGKGLYGRGVVNFPAHQIVVPGGIETYIDNIAYNLIALGGGVDYRFNKRVNLRADFEYQHWFAHDRELPNGLSPYFLTFGAAYHFPAKGPFKMGR